MAINRRGGVYRSDTSIGEGITAIDSAIDQAEAAQLAAQQARDAALVAKTAAETAETNAETAEANAAASATAASTSASQAAGSASSAATSASNAANSASQASTHASNAATSASNASTSASNAATSESNAAGSASAASISAANAAASYDSFDDRYLGSKTTNPTLDNDGNALINGALYFNSVSNEMRVWNGTNWQAAAASTTKRESFTATAGQTLFNVTGGYTVGFLDVYVNGVRFLSGSDYTATNGSTFTMTTGLTAGDIVEVVAFGVFDLANMVKKTGDVMTGNYSITGNVSVTGTLSADNIVPGTPFSFRNKIINGNFDIWQRGVSQTAFGILSADRWIHAPVGAVTFSSSLQNLNPGEVAGASYVVSIDVNNSVAAGDGFILAQKIEDVRTLAGKTVTVSIVAANSSGEDFAVELEQKFGSGGSPAVTTFVGKSTALSSTFTRHSFTVTLPSISGKTIGAGSFLTLNIWLSAGSNFDARTGSLGHNNGVFNITQVQVEEGAVATPFEQRPIGLELSLCQRYFYQPRGDLPGFVSSSTGILCHCTFPVVMRTSPAVALSTTSPVGEAPWFGVSRTASGAGVSGSHLFADAATLVISGFSGLTVNERACIFGHYLSFSAEL